MGNSSKRVIATAAAALLSSGLLAVAAPAMASAQSEKPAVELAQRTDAVPAAAEPSHNFGKFSAANYLSCSKAAKITGTFGLNVSKVTASFKNWTKQDKGKQFTASLGWSTTISAAVDVTGKTACTPGKALKAIAVTFAIGGVPVKLHPDFEFNINAKGDVTASETVAQSIKISGSLGLHAPSVSPSLTPGKPAVTASGSAEFDAQVGAEADITAGVVDLDFELLGGVHGNASAQSSPVGVCVSGYPELHVVGTFGADFFGWHQDDQFLDKTWTYTSVLGHNTKFDLCSYAKVPVITAASFTDDSIELTYTRPGQLGGITDYYCEASPDGGDTIYPCDTDPGLGTTDPVTAPTTVYNDPGYLQIAPGWSMRMAAVTSSGVGAYGPWFKLAG
jgi:hypothetical protein